VDWRSSRAARIGFLAWLGVVVLVVVPWFSMQTHSHWAAVRWIPFVSPPFKILDIVANALFYMPFGFLLVRGFTSRGRRDAVIAGFCLSALTELTQVYSHGRFPSATDLACNTLGAYLGAIWADSRRA
jgi:glycopeptide antibiotics resistance protein